MKKKMILGCILIAVGALSVIAGIIVMTRKGGNETPETGNQEKRIVSCSFSSSGDMAGSLYSLELREKDGGKVVLTETRQEAWNLPQEEKDYEGTREQLDRIEKVFAGSKLSKMNGKQLSDIFVADGATDTIRLSYSDGTFFTAYSQMIEEPYMKTVNEILAIMKETKK